MAPLKFFRLSALFLMVMPPMSASAHPPCGIVVDGDARVYFVHPFRNRVYRIDRDGKLTVLVEGTRDRGPTAPHHLVIDPAGNLFTASDQGGTIWKISPRGEVSQWYPQNGAPGVGFLGSGGDPFTIDGFGNIYCVNQDANRTCAQILRIEPCGHIREFAGGAHGVLDGGRDRAEFGDLHGAGFAWGVEGPLYLTDDGARVRRVTPEGEVRTIAGGRERGFADGKGGDARFVEARGLCIAPDRTIFVADAEARRIRRVAPDGTVTTIAGSGASGGNDGAALEATFEAPASVAIAPDGTLYVLDSYGRDAVRVRELSTRGTVRTIAKSE